MIDNVAFPGQSRINMDNAQLLNLPVADYLALNLSRIQQMESLSALLDELEQTPGLDGAAATDLANVLAELLGFTVNNRLFEDAKKVYQLAERFNALQNKNLN